MISTIQHSHNNTNIHKTFHTIITVCQVDFLHNNIIAVIRVYERDLLHMTDSSRHLTAVLFFI